MIPVLAALLLSLSIPAPQTVDAVLEETKPYTLKPPGGPGDARRVTRDLLQRSERDKVLRDQYSSLARSPAAERKAESIAKLRQQIDTVTRANAEVVEDYAEIYGWFPRSQWDWAAGWHAALIVQQADHDPVLQRRVLATMRPLVATGEVSEKTYALLFDRVAATLDLPQRYGSQGQCMRPGVWEPLPMEEPDKVDARRNRAGLEPLAQFAAFESRTCR